ncbi:MAG TPA: hypothetical protein PKZ83_16525 [bacterium]|nr:hypothetical protein [bacterium]HQJ66268.1 hypothetical protein [bacterium]
MKRPVIFFFLFTSLCNAQMMDSFDKGKIEGWFLLTGDGNAAITLEPKNGYATMTVDGSKDKYNCYWTCIKRDVTSFLDLAKLKDPNYQLRVEARVRLHNAPRRLNFMVNTNRTTDFHIDLMEYDIADTTGWHVISMTTKKFDARPGDSVYVQLCATDFGLEKDSLDIDYYRADIVHVKEAGEDQGEPIRYHPPIPKTEYFSHHLPVAQDGMINPDFPEVNFNDWHGIEKGKKVRTITVAGNAWGILKWDFSSFKNAKVAEAGLLELVTQSVQLGGDYIKAFGQDFGIEFPRIRVIEVLAGDADWDQASVTYNSLTGGSPYSKVFNAQMIYDFDAQHEPGGRNFITIPRPVMERLINGETKGLLIRPLGALVASFYASENQAGKYAAKLHFNLAR